MTAHRIVNPGDLLEPKGFAHAVVAAPGRTVYLAGQTAHDAEGRVRGETIAEQLDAAAGNLLRALEAAGGRPEYVVSLQVFVTDVAEYRASLRELAGVWRRRFGRHYPAMALLEVNGLVDPAARVEIMGVAVIPS
jgi:enamine deaminase RidA (YjgF/YER057c/UK114 family)